MCRGVVYLLTEVLFSTLVTFRMEIEKLTLDLTIKLLFVKDFLLLVKS